MVSATITSYSGDILNVNFVSIEQPQVVYERLRIKTKSGTAFIAGTPHYAPFRVEVAEGYNDLFKSLISDGPDTFNMLWMGTTGHLVKAEMVYFLDEQDDNDHVHILYPRYFKLLFPNQEIR